ncbi:hypothetical protein KCU77_g106, partial [Aureobasidium melanogenum]
LCLDRCESDYALTRDKVMPNFRPSASDARDEGAFARSFALASNIVQCYVVQVRNDINSNGVVPTAWVPVTFACRLTFQGPLL